ncbi:MAG: hypothetical protein M5U19_02205 [Microthrixaceae bacterium]|nr:hypothetical protein [Microthrixaceae bacterium]
MISDPASGDSMESSGPEVTQPAIPDGPDPAGSVTTTTACVPTLVAGATEDWPTVTEGFDPSTVEELADPSTVACDQQLDVMVVGDSTGRGFLQRAREAR